MKKIIIAGAGSYIGDKLAAHLEKTGGYRLTVVDLQRAGWQDEIGFCDALVQVAGIAHARETKENAALYYKVNRDMAYECAKLAKAKGAVQFIYMSSMSVYGRATGHITADTPLQPVSHYGKSKATAEALLGALEDEDFRVAVLRPPMVYGPGCRGNYPRLSALARRLPLFPALDQQRSMVYIGNLCEALRLLIDTGQGGLFFPQDAAYHNVPGLMVQIAGAHGKNLRLVPGFGGILGVLAGRIDLFGKVFGSLTYDMDLPGAPGDYQLFSNEEAVLESERSVMP